MPRTICIVWLFFAGWSLLIGSGLYLEWMSILGNNPIVDWVDERIVRSVWGDILHHYPEKVSSIVNGIIGLFIFGVFLSPAINAGWMGNLASYIDNGRNFFRSAKRCYLRFLGLSILQFIVLALIFIICFVWPVISAGDIFRDLDHEGILIEKLKGRVVVFITLAALTYLYFIIVKALVVKNDLSIFWSMKKGIRLFFKGFLDYTMIGLFCLILGVATYYCWHLVFQDKKDSIAYGLFGLLLTQIFILIRILLRTIWYRFLVNHDQIMETHHLLNSIKEKKTRSDFSN